MLLSSANKIRAADRRDDPGYTPVRGGIARMVGKQGMANRIVISEEGEKKDLER